MRHGLRSKSPGSWARVRPSPRACRRTRRQGSAPCWSTTRLRALSCGGSDDNARLSDGGGKPEAFTCDQCGDVREDGELSICAAPGCGVAFSQCRSCEADYEGCCSAACQASASQRNGDARSSSVETSGLSTNEDSSRRARLQAVERGEMGGSDGPTTTRNTEADTLGETRTRDGLNGVGGSNGGGDEAMPPRSIGEAAETTRTGETEDGESILEDYASRHSTPESWSLGRVREYTERCSMLAGDRPHF